MTETRMLIYGAALLGLTNAATYIHTARPVDPCYISYIIPAPSQLELERDEAARVARLEYTAKHKPHYKIMQVEWKETRRKER